MLITSGEHYGAVLNRAFDFRKYLDALAEDKLNLTRVFAGTYREVAGESFGIARNTLAPDMRAVPDLLPEVLATRCFAVRNARADEFQHNLFDFI